MEDNNTSAFNCRMLPSGRAWALHAYGRAIDVNPLINPFIDSEATSSRRRPGHTSTAIAPILGSCMRAIRPSAPSPIAAGAGAATGELRRTTSISSVDRSDGLQSGSDVSTHIAALVRRVLVLVIAKGQNEVRVTFRVMYNAVTD